MIEKGDEVMFTGNGSIFTEKDNIKKGEIYTVQRVNTVHGDTILALVGKNYVHSLHRFEKVCGEYDTQKQKLKI